MCNFIFWRQGDKYVKFYVSETGNIAHITLFSVQQTHQRHAGRVQQRQHMCVQRTIQMRSQARTR